MSTINRSDIVKKISDSFPNFIKKDILKLTSIILDTIKDNLRKGYRVELRDIIMFEAKKYESKISRNPKTNEKVFVPEKKIVRLKISKKWARELNEKT